MFGISKPFSGGMTITNEPKEKLERLLINRASTSKQRKPMIVITYDDGVSQDYTKAFNIHELYGVPMTVGVVGFHLLHPDVTIIENDSWVPITVSQLAEIRDSPIGHEIASHTMTHRLLGARQLGGTMEAGRTSIVLDSQQKYFTPTTIEESVECVIVEGDVSENVRVLRREENAVIISEPLQNTFSPSAYIRLSDKELEYEIKGSKDILESYGFPTKGILFPGARHCHESRMIMAKHYEYGRAVDHQNEDMITQSNPFPTYAIGCPVVEYNTIAELEVYMDEAVATNGTLFLLAHSPANTHDKLKAVIEAAQARDMEFVTASEAVERMGNMLEIGDTSYDKETHVFPRGKGYFAVNNDFGTYPKTI